MTHAPWARWIPEIVVEVVSEGGEKRDYEEKRREYLAAGVKEYWIIDPARRQVLVLQRAGDTFIAGAETVRHVTPLLPAFTLGVPRLFVAQAAD